MGNRPTIETIREAFQRIHRVASGSSREAYMSIPPDPERDADLILDAAIDELEKLRAVAEAARRLFAPDTEEDEDRRMRGYGNGRRRLLEKAVRDLDRGDDR